MKGLKRIRAITRVGNKNPYVNIAGVTLMFWAVAYMSGQSFGTWVAVGIVAFTMILYFLYFIDQVKVIQARNAEKKAGDV